MDVLDRLNVLGTPMAIAVTSTLFLSAYLFYRWLLPKPIPGIPYNEEATKTIFGDIPSMLKHLSHSKTFTDWIVSNNLRHKAPMVQMFTSIFGKPWVVISDNREAQDILLRRTKEFDKPDAISDMLYSIAPDHHTVQATNDRWRAQRKLLQDLMVPSFLNGVAGPEVYNNLMDLIELWNVKERLSEGRPWSVKDDIYDVALESIWAAVFGIEETATVTKEQLALLTPLKSIDLPASKDEEAVFERAPAPVAFDAVIKLTDSLEMVGKSPMPRIQGLIMRHLMPSIKRLMALRDKAIKEEVIKAEKRMNASGKTDNIKAAVDHMLRREKMFAEKQGRKPDYHSKVMYAELFGLLLAGHDTTSTSILWSLKLLASNPDVQTRLRKSLQDAFPAAHASGSVPTAAEIATTTNYYLDACIEELLRCGHTANVCSRGATQDAVVLGHVIPKGTRVILMTGAHGVSMPAYKIDNSLRSENYKASEGGKTGFWDEEGMDVFNPDRWLVTSEKGEKVFDSQAGPHLLFGGGLRGCFGKRLAYLEKRLALVLILWHFVLEDVPEKYASYEAQELLTHSPVHCYVRLRKV